MGLMLLQLLALAIVLLAWTKFLRDCPHVRPLGPRITRPRCELHPVAVS